MGDTEAWLGNACKGALPEARLKISFSLVHAYLEGCMLYVGIAGEVAKFSNRMNLQC